MDLNMTSVRPSLVDTFFITLFFRFSPLWDEAKLAHFLQIGIKVGGPNCSQISNYLDTYANLQGRVLHNPIMKHEWLFLSLLRSGKIMCINFCTCIIMMNTNYNVGQVQ